jgi:hypothetical protein
MIKYLVKIISIFVIFLGVTAFTPPKLVKRKLSDEVTVKLPEDFRPMTDDEIASRYYTYKKPTAMFTDPNVKISFGLNLNDTEWKYKDLEIMKSFYKSSFMRIFSNVNMIQEKVEKINNYQFAIFEFVSEVKSDEEDIRQLAPVLTYTYILYTIYENKAIVINFSCPEALKDKWQPVAREIMQTVVVK